MRRQPPRPLRPGPAPHWGGPARGVSPGLPVQPALTAGSCVRGVAVPSGLHLWHRRPAGAPQENRQGGPPRGSPRHFLRDSTRLATSWRTGRGGPLGVVCLASLVDRARLPRPPAVLLLRLGALSSPAGGRGAGAALRSSQPHRPRGSLLRTFRSHQAAASSLPVRKVHHGLRIGSRRAVCTCAKWGNRGGPRALGAEPTAVANVFVFGVRMHRGA